MFEEVEGKLNKYRLKTKAAIEKRCDAILKKYHTTDFLQYTINNNPVTTYKNKRKGRPAKEEIPEQVAVVTDNFSIGLDFNQAEFEQEQARQKGILLPDASSELKGWSARDKFSTVLETAAMNESELAEYCRKKGIYSEQVLHWRQACENVNDWDRQVANKLKAGQKEDQKRIKHLERELKRKEKALAEVAALLVLQKKVQAIWGDPEGE